MAFVRRRSTKAGGVSTTLVGSYRDAAGRPRQRVLANLHGCATPLEALAKLAAQRQALRKEKAEAGPELKAAAEFYRDVMTAQLEGYKFSAKERKEIDPLLKARERLLRRADRVNALLACVQKDGAAIRKHCDTSENEIQAAIRQYRKNLERAESALMGSEFFVHKAKSDLRRLSLGGVDGKFKDMARWSAKIT